MNKRSSNLQGCQSQTISEVNCRIRRLASKRTGRRGASGAKIAHSSQNLRHLPKYRLEKKLLWLHPIRAKWKSGTDTSELHVSFVQKGRRRRFRLEANERCFQVIKSTLLWMVEEGEARHSPLPPPPSLECSSFLSLPRGSIRKGVQDAAPKEWRKWRVAVMQEKCWKTC